MALSAPTARIMPSAIAMLASKTASGVTSLPPRITRSALALTATSQHCPAAVDRQVDAGDLPRHVAGEKQAGIGDIDVGRYALERVIRGVQRGGVLQGDVEAARHVGTNFVAEARAVDHAGRNVIDVDVVDSYFERKTLGDAAQPPFGCRIGHSAGAPAHAEGPADIDDLAVALRDHCREYRAHGVETATHVDRDDIVELVLAGLHAGPADRSGAAGDIEQDVDAFAKTRLRCPCGRAALLAVRHVTGDDDRVAAAGFYLLGEQLDGGRVAAHERKLAALSSEGMGDRGSHAFDRSGDDGDTALELEIHRR